MLNLIRGPIMLGTGRGARLGPLLWRQCGRIRLGIAFMPRGWWWHIWLPHWHNGRGRYISIGLWIVAIYRGY